MNTISFCISTNGKKIFKTKFSIYSIARACSKVPDVKYEIIVGGNVEGFMGLGKYNTTLLNYEDEANTGKLAKLRNLCAARCSGDVIVFLDDDILFDDNWLLDLISYTNNNTWDVLGNRILMPNGDRYWDRSIIGNNYQYMVDYDHTDSDDRLYQTGCFWIVNKLCFDKHKWDPNIAYYAARSGGVNEDVEYSKRLHMSNVKLKFNQRALVWHWDETYKELLIRNSSTDKGEVFLVCQQMSGLIPPMKYRVEFQLLLNELYNEHITN